MMKTINKCRICFLTLLVMVFLAIPNLVEAQPVTTRLAGQDRYETAAVIAKTGWTQSDYAVLACGDDFPDALSASPLAKKYSAPILLTTKVSLPVITKQTLIDLKVKNVFIVGGNGVVSVAVESELLSMGISISRFGGNDRYETAIQIAKNISSPSTIFVAIGNDYPDALSVAPIAAQKQIPIILVPNNYVPDIVKNYLSTLNVSKSYVIGNSDIIDDGVFNQLPNPERITGIDKYTRNIAVVNKFASEFTGSNIYAATGDTFADALTGTTLASYNNSPIVLVSNYLSDSTKAYLAQNVSMKQLFILGGTGAVSDSIFGNLTTTTSVLSASDISRLVSPSVLYIEVYDSSGKAFASGSGFVVESNGKIATNYHVIKGATSAKVVFTNGRSYGVTKIYAYDENRDIAVLGIDGNDISTVKIGDSSAINSGDKIYTIGSPNGLDNTIADGLISNKSRIGTDGQEFIQISAPISHGSSGGALINEKGEVIGITSSGFDEAQNLNFAIPINALKPFLTQDINKTLQDISASVDTTSYGKTSTSGQNVTYFDIYSYIKGNYGINYIAGYIVKYNIRVTPYSGNSDGTHKGSAFIEFEATADTEAAENMVILNYTTAYMQWFKDMMNDIQMRYGGIEYNGGTISHGKFMLLFHNWYGYPYFWVAEN